MDMIKQWIISLIFACAAGTLVSVISPKGSGEKTLRTVVGIFVIAAICAPLSELDADDFTIPAFAYEYSEYNEYGMNEYLTQALEEEISRRISEIVEKNNLSIGDVTVKAENNNDCIIIHNLLIKAQNNEYESAQNAAEILSDELGIPVTLTE